jgi:acyl carrier protein
MSDNAEVETTVHEIICDVLGLTPDALGRDEALAANGWDSIASLEALALLERNFEITLDLRSFHAAHTVAQMAELVASGLTVKTNAQ